MASRRRRKTLETCGAPCTVWHSIFVASRVCTRGRPSLVPQDAQSICVFGPSDGTDVEVKGLTFDVAKWICTLSTYSRNGTTSGVNDHQFWFSLLERLTIFGYSIIDLEHVKTMSALGHVVEYLKPHNMRTCFSASWSLPACQRFFCRWNAAMSVVTFLPIQAVVTRCGYNNQGANIARCCAFCPCGRVEVPET